jgi:hypothetical protein
VTTTVVARSSRTGLAELRECAERDGKSFDEVGLLREGQIQTKPGCSAPQYRYCIAA